MAITVGLCAALLPGWHDNPLENFVRILFWPVTVLMYLAGPGPLVGPPERNMHEFTPVHLVAFLLGAGLTCIFYSALVFVLLRIHKKYRASASQSTV